MTNAVMSPNECQIVRSLTDEPERSASVGWGGSAWINVHSCCHTVSFIHHHLLFLSGFASQGEMSHTSWEVKTNAKSWSSHFVNDGQT